VTYDPWHDLRSREHLTLAFSRLPLGQALYFHDVPGIVLDERLSRVERRCALAHELAHLDLGHLEQAAQCGLQETARIARRMEVHADQLASRRLVPVERLAEVAVCYSERSQVADALNVTEHLLAVRLAHLHPAERGYINSRIAATEEVA
jgi:Zn-dependent peptidase ImmA (M78 family)